MFAQALDSIADKILLWPKPSKVCSSREVEQISRLAEVLKRFLRTEMLAFVRRNSQEPLLFFYSSDCTPTKTVEAWSRTSGNLHVRRRGRHSQELLQQRLYCMNSSGEVRVLLDEPRVLADKTSWTHLEAYRHFFELPRRAGHLGLVIEHFVWDRAVADPTFRHVQQLQKAAAAEDRRGVGPAAGGELQALLSWTTTSACANHDVHNGLKWSIMECTRDPATLKGAFVCIESLRNSYSSLVAQVTKWLGGVLAFEDWEGYPVAEHFVFLGLEPEACELATALQARFDQGKFKVSTRYKADEGILDMIVTLLLSVWAFKRWTESRWLSMGPSCRIMLSALALGLDTFVRWCLRQPGQSRYFLGGFEDYFSPQLAVLIAVIGTSSFVADAALNCLLEDDRLATRITVLESDMLDELRFISGIDDKIWAFFGRLADTPGRLLKHQALGSGFIAAGHIKWRSRVDGRPHRPDDPRWAESPTAVAGRPRRQEERRQDCAHGEVLLQ